MIAVPQPSARLKPAWHAAFLGMLPDILRYARFAFRHLDPEAHEEAVQEAVVNALFAFARLVELGKTNVAYPSALARYAVAQIRTERRVATSMNSRDVYTRTAQEKGSFDLERLDRYDREEDAWQEVLVEDRRATPAELAASRIDFAEWLQWLPPKNRRIAETLATGETTKRAARLFRLSPGRISQLRRELKDAWEEFHGPEAEA